MEADDRLACCSTQSCPPRSISPERPPNPLYTVPVAGSSHTHGTSYNHERRPLQGLGQEPGLNIRESERAAWGVKGQGDRPGCAGRLPEDGPGLT